MDNFEFEGLRHFAVWQNKTVVVLIGYSNKQNNVLCVCLDHLPEDERHELIQIATNDSMQKNRLELASTLYQAKHSKSGDTWMTNLVMRLRRGDGSVVQAFVKNLNNVVQDQMDYYKGYNKPKLNISDAEKAAIMGQDYKKGENSPYDGLQKVGDPRVNHPPRDDDMFDEMSEPYAREKGATRINAFDDPKAVSAAPNDALAAALSQLAQSQVKMAETLTRIEDKIKPPKRGRPSRAVVKSVKPSVAETESSAS